MHSTYFNTPADGRERRKTEYIWFIRFFFNCEESKGCKQFSRKQYKGTLRVKTLSKLRVQILREKNHPKSFPWWIFVNYKSLKKGLTLESTKSCLALSNGSTNCSLALTSQLLSLVNGLLPLLLSASNGLKRHLATVHAKSIEKCLY